MNLYCYRKKEKINIKGIAEKIYLICYNLNKADSSIFSKWILYFKKKWSFDISELTEQAFANKFIDCILEENEVFLNKKGYALNSTVTDDAGFAIALFCEIKKRSYIFFQCNMGVFSDLLINSTIVRFPKDFPVESKFIEIIIEAISPQWATFTEELLYNDIAKFSQDIVPGYIMYFEKSIVLPKSEVIKTFEKIKENGSYLYLTNKLKFSEEARNSSMIVSNYFKANEISFNTLLH